MDGKLDESDKSMSKREPIIEHGGHDTMGY
jgi:hypothetical protein